ncbi:hypothetical protein R1flu_007688 [Riccia fluitans]|uniref:Microtubule-associated protein n=1 Tax=Riccia fluitans TaxID=41844 RepID=A0ABD1Z0S6_9MARC
MKLMKENSQLIDEVQRAKEAEERMSLKLKDQAFEITLMKRQLSMRGVRDVSPASFRYQRDVSPARSRQKLPHHSPYRSILSARPSFESRSSSASRKSPSPSFSSRSGSRSSSCPGLRSLRGSALSSPRAKPPLDARTILTTSRDNRSSPIDTSDPMGRKSPRPSIIRMAKAFSPSSSGSNGNHHSMFSSLKRAEDEKAEKRSGNTPSASRTVRGLAMGEDINSRLCIV